MTVPAHPLRVLILDDEDYVRLVLSEALAAEGCRVHIAASGQQGLELLKVDSFDCVITDLRMPGTDGRAVLRWVGEHQPEVDVIVLTGYGEVQAAVEAIKAGAWDFIVKSTPFDGSQVKAALAKLRTVRLLKQENLALRHGGGRLRTDDPVPGISPAWRSLMGLVEKIAPSRAPVLIQGETGAGKEVVARLLHARSPRQDGPFLAVNCGAIKGDLLQSELFGYEKGAFTGATAAKTGLFAAAEGGTLFLDEIGQMGGPMQVSLLRVLDRGEYRRVGGTRPLYADVRCLAASNQDLQDLVFEGRFRDDLLYRINTVAIRVPALRERPDDIPLLAEHFLRTMQPPSQPARVFSEAAVERLKRYGWPGNVRELRNVIERLLLLSEPGAQIIGEEDVAAMLPNRSKGTVPPSVLEPLEEVEKGYILRVLQAHVGNKTQAARTLGIDYKTLLSKLRKYDLPA